MMVRQRHSISDMAVIWLLPVASLVPASSTGGLLAEALKSYSVTSALITVAWSFTMVAIGLSLALMMITAYLMRLIIHGPPNTSLIFSAFIVLSPLGQGGFSLLINGEVLSELLPARINVTSPEMAPAGQMIYAVCFCVAYALWSMSIAWIVVSFFSAFYVLRGESSTFSLSYWGLVFPNGVFALLSVQLGKVLDSPFFRAFGAVWTGVVFLLWLCIFLRSIPSIIDGSIDGMAMAQSKHELGVANVTIFLPAVDADTDRVKTAVAASFVSISTV